MTSHSISAESVHRVGVSLHVFAFTGEYKLCPFETHECDLNAICVENGAEYECVCKEGYSGSGKQCETKGEGVYYEFTLLLTFCIVESVRLTTKTS